MAHDGGGGACGEFLVIQASDIAYIIALIERAPSNYPRRAYIIDQLQYIYRACQGRKYGGDVIRAPIEPTYGILEVERS